MKLTVIGAGTIGSGVAYNAAVRGAFDEIMLVDLDEEKARGEAYDISHAVAPSNSTEITAGGYDEATDADVVAMTAGKPRKEGMTRADLLDANIGILRSVFDHDWQNDPVFVTTTNPMDVINYAEHLISDLPKERFIGFGGWLDSARMQFILADYLDVPTGKVRGYVIGQHGDTQVPVFSRVTVDGKPVDISADDRSMLRERMKESAMDVISRKGGTEWAPTRGVADIVTSVARDDKRVVPCSTVLDGEYGYSDISVGVPAVIGADGVEAVVEWELSDWEQERFYESAETMEELCSDARDQIDG